MNNSIMKSIGKCWLLSSVLFLGGCDMLKGPEAEEIPTTITMAEKKAAEPQQPSFSAEEGVVHWKETAWNVPNDPKKPDKFRVTRVDSAEILWVQSVETVKVGNPPRDQKVYGVPDRVRLAGIVTPLPNQPGYAESVKKVTEWTLWPDVEVDVEQDPVFPRDLNGRPMVQIFFPGRTGKTKGTMLNLNRMLIRLGYAVVDIHSPTSLDTKPWLNDEQFARNFMPDPKTKVIKPLGLWGKGIILQQRPLPPMPKGAQARVQNIVVTLPGDKRVKEVKKTTRTITRNRTGATTAPAVTTTPSAPTSTKTTVVTKTTKTLKQ